MWMVTVDTGVDITKFGFYKVEEATRFVKAIVVNLMPPEDGRNVTATMTFVAGEKEKQNVESIFDIG